MSTMPGSTLGALTPAQKLAAARYKGCAAFPYLAPALLSLVPRESRDVPTLGTSDKLLMVWNPDYVASITLEELMAVLIHEVMHPLRSHHVRIKMMAPGDHFNGNVACDREINDDLVAMRLQLPGEPCLPADINMPNGKLAEEYYLEAQRQQKPQQGGSNGQPQPGKGGTPGAGSSTGKEPGVGEGHCGTCAGHGHGTPDEAEDAPGGRSPAEVQAMQRQVAAGVKAHIAAKGRGSVPGGLDRWADTVLAPPRIRWQDKLQRATRRAVAYRAGAVDFRHTRPSRKQACVGYGVGRPILSALVAPVPRVTVAIDTSGSMGAREMQTAMEEIAGVLSAIGTSVQFIACDAMVHTDKQCRDWREIARGLKGGGGTDFNPMFEAARRARPAPEVLIFVTDGDGPAPAEPPPGMTVIWVLVGPYKRVPADYGEAHREACAALRMAAHGVGSWHSHSVWVCACEDEKYNLAIEPDCSACRIVRPPTEGSPR